MTHAKQLFDILVLPVLPQKSQPSLLSAFPNRLGRLRKKFKRLKKNRLQILTSRLVHVAFIKISLNAFPEKLNTRKDMVGIRIDGHQRERTSTAV